MKRDLLGLIAAGALLGCRAVVDPGIEYCTPPIDEPFASQVTLDALAARCWKFEGEPGEIVPEDGDLVMRTALPPDGAEDWIGNNFGPFAYQTVKPSKGNASGDFLFVTRVETLLQDGRHCVTQRNASGLVVREAEGTRNWFGLFFGPTQACWLANPALCQVPDSSLPSHAHARAKGSPLAPPPACDELPTMGQDVEADLAVCRYLNVISYYYRAPESPTTAPVWVDIEPDRERVLKGIVEVGLAAAGGLDESPNPSPDLAFNLEAHFTWVHYRDALSHDGCLTTLAEVRLPHSSE